MAAILGTVGDTRSFKTAVSAILGPVSQTSHSLKDVIRIAL